MGMVESPSYTGASPCARLDTPYRGAVQVLGRKVRSDPKKSPGGTPLSLTPYVSMWK
jgi:hypothetical protein